MKSTRIFTLIFIFSLANSFSNFIHHNIYVSLDIGTKSIDVIDSIIIPLELQKEKNNLNFSLNSDLKPQSLDKDISIALVSKSSHDTTTDSISTDLYEIIIKHSDKPKTIFPIKYSGKIEGDIHSGPVEYARGFSETSGIISDVGVYLSGSTYWVPQIGSELFSFNMTVQIDSGLGVVSQGKRILNVSGIESNNKNIDKKFISYESPEPMTEVYLVAAKWQEYSQKINGIDVQVFLRNPDEKLADKYLNITAKYLEMYEKMLGKYPYSKFAVVENFWETGYGMPSFTLLGEKVIRLPFIPFTSYPHELLHNWWGNSVYVDYDKGNWCEGLTAYLADHLLKEKQGLGWEYRRNTLQKYTDFVNENNDFPVVEFKSRQNPAQEAIGYGKCLMFNHMLRLEVGDEDFIKSYRKFYDDYKFKIADFDDIRKCFENVSGKNLKPLFEQWLHRSGAPKLTLSEASVKDIQGAHEVSFKVSQIQKDEIFDLKIPVAIYLEGRQEALIEFIHINKMEQQFKFKFDEIPLRIELDPLFDVFRTLDRSEVPTTISQVFGAKKSILILPTKSPFVSEYESMANTFKKSQEVQGKSLEIKYDKDFDYLPNDSEIWLFGFENKFAKVLHSDINNSEPSSETFIGNYTSEIPDTSISKLKNLYKTGSVVFTIPNPGNIEHTLCFVATGIKEAVLALTSKLPHYAKYSYLGFEGKEAVNTVKGELPILDSSMRFIFWCNDNLPKLKDRKSLGD